MPHSPIAFNKAAASPSLSDDYKCRDSTSFHKRLNLVRDQEVEVRILPVPAGSTRDTLASRAAIKSIRSKARLLFVPIVSVEKRLVAETFQRDCKPTKYRIAVLLAACFPSLTWYLPSKRKIYAPEDRRMQYFDAAAAGLAYFAATGDADVVQQFLSNAESFRRPLTSGA